MLIAKRIKTDSIKPKFDNSFLYESRTWNCFHIDLKNLQENFRFGICPKKSKSTKNGLSNFGVIEVIMDLSDKYC